MKCSRNETIPLPNTRVHLPTTAATTLSCCEFTCAWTTSDTAIRPAGFCKFYHGQGATGRSKIQVAGPNQDKSQCSGFMEPDQRKSGKQCTNGYKQSQDRGPLQAQPRAKDLKTNTRKPKNLEGIQVNSPERNCFVSSPGHWTSFK